MIPIFAWLSFAVAAQPSAEATTHARIDATTQKSFDRTFARVEESLPLNLRAKFEQAWIVIMTDTVERLDPDLPESSALVKMRQALHGKTALEVISAAEIIVRRLIDDEHRRLAKTTSVDLPRPTDISKVSSLTCEAIVSTAMDHASPGVSTAYEITPESLFRNNVPIDGERIEAVSRQGTDRLALEIGSVVAKIMTMASVEQGNAIPAEFSVIVNDAEQIVMFGMMDTAPMRSANVIVMNKQTGFAVWTKTRAADLFANVPNSQIHYLQCR